jgi:hypothetical protein
VNKCCIFIRLGKLVQALSDWLPGLFVLAGSQLGNQFELIGKVRQTALIQLAGDLTNGQFIERGENQMVSEQINTRRAGILGFR